MGDFERTVREFKRTLTGGRQKTAPLDIMGKVTRVEDGVAWVRFAGSEVGDTPVRMNIDCKVGDVVQVRSSGGKAWIVGNQSAPPTDDSKAKEVEQKTEKFAERIKSVEKVAGDAEEIANAVNQKVWSDEGGLHIADGKQDAAAERNTIWNSLGMLFRKGLNPILGILTGDNPRVAIYDGQGSASENEVAHFGVTSSVGRNDDYNISIAPENFELNNGSNNGNATLFRVGASGNPTSEIYQKTEHLNYQEQTVLSDTPVSGSTITVKIIYLVGTFDFKSQTLTFAAGTSATKAWVKGNVKYTAPRTFEYSGSVFSIEATYSVQADAIDLGILQFGSRQDGGVGNNSTTIGNELVAPYSYQTVVGKHNAPVDAPFVVGIGNPLENKNGVTIDWNGTIRTHKNSMKTLLSGAEYMNGNQDLTFSEPVSEQLTGIVLVWSWWSTKAEDYGWRTFFVPKAMVQLHDGVGYDCPLSRPKSSYFGHKYVYIYDTHIKGHADNVATGTANNVPYANNKWVLRYVFGC